MKKITVALIGLGYWGPQILRNMQKISNVNVKYGVDLLEKNLANTKSLYPGILVTKSYKEVLADETVDAVIIATPTNTHFKIAKDSINANKHVLLEKPCTTNSKLAKTLILLAKKNKCTFMASYPFVYSEPVKLLKKLVNNNVLGSLYYYQSTRINLGIIRHDIDVIWDLAIHDLSILQHLLDEKPISVYATGAHFITKKQSEIANIALYYPSGFLAQIHVSWLSPLKIRTVMIGGSKQMVVYDDINPIEKVKLYQKGIDILPQSPLQPVYRNGNTLSPNIKNIEPLENELTHFIKCIQDKKTPLTDGEKAIEILTILEAISKSLSQKRRVTLS